ncbi:cytochrome P450 [Lasiosphaeria miniovina]|uniref:Cytochrome P450 n=1 Tax=Lasiosphaeria miniovina TaxID=1954250 RepID=A0AA40AX01_9PEZI|nr:cytochrome P450 [Lasiosphaeria miniovina]KAK0723551.1 cytochrome P450 [Lasiosphaeria miniovina]
MDNWPLVGVAALAALLYPLYQIFLHPLSRYPGPLLAKLTDYWRFRDVRSRRSHLTRVALHERHGPVVRVGPNMLSIADPAYIPKIYGPGQGFLKSPFYQPFEGWVGEKIGYNLFTTRDPAYHAALKQPVAAAYGFKSALEFEPIVDQCIETMVRRIDELIVQAKVRKACDLAGWMQYYAFDVMAIMTYGKAFGFLERGEDVNHMIARLDARLDVISPESQMPWLDWLQRKNWVVNIFRDRTNPFATIAASLIRDRQAALIATSSSEDAEKKAPSPRLFIDHFLDAQETHPAVVDSRTVVIYTTTNIMAGSDTVAIALRTLFYMVLRHAGVRARLLAELDAAAPGLTFPVSWEQSQRLPYLDAVIQESLRIHPPVGLPLERVVPAAGLTMRDGSRVPAGVQVGCHAWPIHLLDPVWGPEPKQFRPERWLRAAGESAEAHAERVAAMKRTMLAFGAGSRMCMGRHLAAVQIAKLVPSLLMKFRFELVEPLRDWDLVCGWFVRQANMDVFVDKR